MVELLLPYLAVVVAVHLLDEGLHEALSDRLGVFLVVDLAEHGLHVLEGHQIVVIGIELIEVFI